MNVHWLFVGGPADGRTLWVEAGKSIRIAVGDDDRKYFDYRGHDYVYNGRIYRIGAIDPADLVPSKVTDLIQSTGLEPVE